MTRLHPLIAEWFEVTPPGGVASATCGRSLIGLHLLMAEWRETTGGRGLRTHPLTPPPFRCLQAVQLDRHIQLLDCPGVVMATGTPQNATITPLRGVLAPEKLQDPLGPATAILRRCPPEQVGRTPPVWQLGGGVVTGCPCVPPHLDFGVSLSPPKQLSEIYGVPPCEDPRQFLSHLARRQGRLRPGGVPDPHAAAVALLRDWNRWGTLPLYFGGLGGVGFPCTLTPFWWVGRGLPTPCIIRGA